MRILGVDPGLATIGLGIIAVRSKTDIEVLDWLTITTPPRTPLPERLCELAADLARVLADLHPDLAVVEKLFFATNERTAMDVAHARGVILRELSAAGIPVLEPTPLQLKLGITGDGSADKRQMQTMLRHLLKLQELPRPDDAADALALAVYGALHGNDVRERVPL